MNAVTDPSMEVGVSNWFQFGSAAAPVQSNEQAHQGTYSCKSVTTAATAGVQHIQSPLPSVRKGVGYRTSGWVKGTAGVVITLRWQGVGAGGTVRGIETYTLTGGWDYCEAAGIHDGGGNGTARIQVYANQATTFYLDDVVFEEEPHPMLAEVGGML